MQFSNCRMRKNEYPFVDEVLMVEVTDVTDTGVSCKLLQYDNHEAYMSINEWSRKRVKSMKNFTKSGIRFAAQVLRVEPEKGYVDVSKKNVTQEEGVNADETFKKECNIYNIIQRVSTVSTLPMLDLYESWIWPISNLTKNNNDIDQVESLFVKSMDDVQVLHPFMENLKNNISNNATDSNAIKECCNTAEMELIKVISHRYVKKPVKIAAKVKVFCHGLEGVDAVKQALSEGKKASLGVIDTTNNNQTLFITVDACPVYNIFMTSLNDKLAMDTVEKSIKQIEYFCKQKSSLNFEVVEPAHIIKN